LPAIAVHEELLGRKPYLVTADAALFSQRNETAAHARGVKRVAIPNRSTKSVERKRLEKKRWLRNAQRWRTGCEGRISLKRRHGLNRCRYKGLPGIQRWGGLGVIADNQINIGHALALPSAELAPTSFIPPPVVRPWPICHACMPAPPQRAISQSHFCAGK
jgi:IS5 family transposase